MTEEPNPTPSKSERLKILFDRLQEHSPATSEAHAREILATLLEQVEDGFSGMPTEPESPDRMYPPLDDNRATISQSPEIVRYRSKGSRMFIREDGAILITDLKNNVIFSKPGASGRLLDLSDVHGS